MHFDQVAVNAGNRSYSPSVMGFCPVCLEMLPVNSSEQDKRAQESEKMQYFLL